ncbi:MAG TPA: hypothetical protein VEQ16_06220, partial [Acidocella sp.]|nr:hypothetical protein [Acidocella sp.]
SIGTLGLLSATSDIFLNDASALSIAGTLSTPTLLTLDDAAGITASAPINAGTLTGNIGSSIGGDAILTNSLNNIGTLNNLTTNGTLNLANSTDLDTTGTVAAKDITLVVNGTLGLDGALSASSSGEVGIAADGLTLGTGGTIKAPLGTIAIAPYSDNVLDIGGTRNHTLDLSGTLVQALDSAATALEFGTFAGYAANTVAIESGISIANATLALNASTLISNGGTLNGMLVTLSAGTLANPGSINATTLAFSTGGDFVSTGGITAGTVAGGAGGNISFTGSDNIAALNTLSAAGNIILDNGTTLTLTGPVSATRLTLNNSGNVTEASGSVIDASTFAGSIGGALALGNGNGIGTLGLLTATGNILLGDIAALSIASTLSTPGLLTLNDAAGITASAPILAGALAGTIGGNASLTSSLNNIGTLENLSATSIALNDDTALVIGGTVAANSFTLNNTGTTGTVTEASGGAIDASSFLGSVTSGALLLGGSNSISNVSLADGSGNILLNDTSSGNISLSASTSGELSLEGGSYTESGAISAATLDTGTGGVASAILTLSNNIGTLDNFAAAGALSLSNNASLAVAGTVLAQDIGLLVNGTLGLNGALNAASGGEVGIAAKGLTLGTGGTISAPSGTIAIAPYNNGVLDLGGTAAGGLDLSSTQVGALTSAASVLEFGTFGSYKASSVLVESGVSIAGATLALNATTLISNSGTLAGTLVTLSSGGSILSAGSIGAGIFAGSAGSAISLGGTNNIGTLGNVTAGGNITLANTGSLILAGIVSTPGSFALGNSGAVTETGGAIDAAEFDTNGTAIGGALSLTGQNSINTLGFVAAAGGVALTDKIALSIANTLATPSLLTLDDSAGVTASGPILAGALTGSIGGNADLTSSLNSIGTLEGFTASNIILNNGSNGSTLVIAGTVATGSFTLNNAGTVTEASGGAIDATSFQGSINGALVLGNGNSIGTLGLLTATGDILLNDATALSIANTLATPTLLTLVDAAGVTASGPIHAAAFTGSLGGAGLFSGSNSITTLGAFTSNGTLLLDDTATLNIAGLVSAPSLTLNAAGVTEVTGGTLALAGFGGSLAGGADLGNSNSIGALGNLTISSGTLTLDDAAALQVNGTVSAPAAALTTPSLSVPGLLTVAGLLELQSTSGLAETGRIDAGTLAGSLGGAALLTGGNSISNLGSFTATSITLLEPGTLTLAGPVTATSGQVTLALGGLLEGTGGTLVARNGTIAGTIAIAPYSDGALDLGGTSAGGLELSASLLDALDPTASLVLGQAGSFTANSIVAEGNFSLANPGLLLYSTGQVSLDGTLGANALTIGATGITEPGSASLSAATLTSLGTIAGGVTLAGAASAIATLGAFAATQNLAVTDAGTLAVTGPVSGANIALKAASLALDGVLTTGTGGTLALTANQMSATGASLSAPSGTVSIAPLTAGDEIDLGGTGSGLALSSGLIADVSSNELIIATSGGIVTGGAVSVAPGILLLSAGSGISLGGGLTAPGLLELAGGGLSSTSAGALGAGTLTSIGTLAGAFNLAAGSNHIATLSNFAAAGGVTLADAAALDVTGVVSGPTIALTAAGLTLANALQAGTLAQLQSSNGITETGAGVVDAPTLSSGGAVIAGNVLLNGANSFATLTDFAASGNVQLIDGSALILSGSDNAANMTLSASGFNLAGNITTGTLALASNGAITQTGGNISAAVLTSDGGAIQGAANFGQQNNIATLGAFSATGALTLDDASALTVAGPVAAPEVALSANGLALNGNITTALLQLASGNGVTEGAGGALNAFTLTGAITGGAVLNNGANAIGTLGNFSATGGLAFNDGTALTLDGVIAPGGVLALLDPNGITQTGGAITATQLTSDGGTIGGDALFGAAGNNISAMGAFAATGAVLVAGNGGLNLDGDITAATLSLDPSGAVVQSAGQLNVGVLNADLASIDLSGQNNIGSLNDIIVTGDAAFSGVTSITGSLSAQNATIVTGGSLAVSGNLNVANNLDLGAGGNVTQTGGAINAGSAVVSGQNITLNGNDNVAGLLRLDTSGTVLHDAGVLDAGTLAGTAGQLASFGAQTDIQTLGSFIMQDSVFALANNGPLVLVGPLVANQVSISVNGLLTLMGSANGGLFITGSIASDNAIAPSSSDSVITVNNTGSPEILQTGTFYINAGPAAARYLGTSNQPATLFLNATQSGGIEFATYPAGLYAPSIDLVMAAGT